MLARTLPMNLWMNRDDGSIRVEPDSLYATRSMESVPRNVPGSYLIPDHNCGLIDRLEPGDLIKFTKASPTFNKESNVYAVYRILE